MTLIAVFVVITLAAVVALLFLLRRRAGREEPKTVSIERRLGPTRAPIDPDRGGSSLEFRSVRSSPPRSEPFPELPPDPWGLEPDRSVAPFLAPPPREDRDQEDPPKAAQQP